jgi:hypothetical protein
MWEAEVGRSQSKAALGKSIRLYLKNNLSKKTVGVAQMLEHLPSKCEALSSNTSTLKHTHTHTHNHASKS